MEEAPIPINPKSESTKPNVNAEKVDQTLLQILILHENFLANLLKKFARNDFFLLFFLRNLIGR